MLSAGKANDWVFGSGHTAKVFHMKIEGFLPNAANLSLILPTNLIFFNVKSFKTNGYICKQSSF
jgi:hypothetical protein